MGHLRTRPLPSSVAVVAPCVCVCVPPETTQHPPGSPENVISTTLLLSALRQCALLAGLRRTATHSGNNAHGDETPPIFELFLPKWDKWDIPFKVGYEFLMGCV